MLSSQSRYILGGTDMPATKKTENLDLVDFAKAAADELLAKHPEVVFTSGRRTVAQQANAMAQNVAKNRTWIQETYKDTPRRAALQKWINNHPEAKTVKAISAGLESVMNTWTEAQQFSFSRHIGGKAFDVKPVAGAAGVKIKKTIKSLPNLRTFLEKEGGLVRWHADFEK